MMKNDPFSITFFAAELDQYSIERDDDDLTFPI